MANEYNANGSMIERTNPDGSTFTWVYPTSVSFHLMGYTDEMGRHTAVSGGTVTRDTPLGLVTTTTAYTPTPSTQNDPPAGLAASVTDPLGNRTEYTYNAKGLPTQRSCVRRLSPRGQLFIRTTRKLYCIVKGG